MRVKSNENTFLFCACLLIALMNGIMAKKSAKKMSFNFMSQLTNCDKNENLMVHTDGLDAVRYNESIVYLDGDFKVEENVDTDNIFSVNTEITKILASGGKEIVVTYEMADFCSELERAKTSISSFTSMANSLGIPKKCPIPPGTYTVDKLIWDPQLMQSLRAGEYNIRMTFIKNDIKGMGLSTNIEPRLFGCVSVPLVVERFE